VTHHAVKNLGDFNVSLVVSGDYFPTWSILALVVGDLSDVLGQLVDGKARSSVNCLALNCASSSEYVGWPLPLIIRAGGKKDSKRPLMVSVGDHVMYSGTIDRKYEDLILMKDKDVIGLV